jgi:hypothetical protein
VLKPVAWAKQVFTDAASGSLDRLGAGSGGIFGAWWFYVPWAKRINAGGWRVDGKKVGRKLSALELIGPLIAVTAGHQLFANSHVTCWVDNAGSVAIWRKGYSTKCRLSSTIVTTIAAVAPLVINDFLFIWTIFFWLILKGGIKRLLCRGTRCAGGRGEGRNVSTTYMLVACLHS